MDTKVRFKVSAFDNKNKILKSITIHASDENDVNNQIDDITDFLLQAVEDVQAGEYE